MLAEADLLRRVRPAQAFAEWLGHFLPDLGTPSAGRWLEPVESPDRLDGKLAHLDGLNASRAWMLEGIAFALPASDARRASLSAAAERHRAAALARAVTDVYAGSHWLGTFAVYLLTRRGLGPTRLEPGRGAIV